MKSFLFFSILTLNAFLSSCTLIGMAGDQVVNVNRRSHSQIMDRYNTKDDVIRDYGIPSKRNRIRGKEIWRYMEISGSYTEFHFIEDSVVNWRTRGVDVSEKTELFQTIGLIIDGLLFFPVLFTLIGF